MTNETQETAVDYYINATMALEVARGLNNINVKEYIARKKLIIDKAKQIEKEQKNKFTIEFIKWLYDNEYCYNRKQKMYLKTYIFGSKFFTIEELFILFNETYGGNK